jgi:hypothetical protein
MKRIVGFGEVIDGKLVLRNRDHFNEQLRQTKGFVEVTVEKARSRRSLNQNAYYWAVVIPMVTDALRELGNECEHMDVHELLKDRFNTKNFVIPNNGETVLEVITVGASTASLSTIDFMAYIERIQRWASEFLHLNIPDPNQEVSE